MKRVAVIGGGVSGNAAAKLCRRYALECTVVSDGADVTLPDADIYVVSPGVPPEKSPLYQAAENSGKEVISELEFGFRFWKKPVLAVTGTNGKTTTTELTVHLLRACGVNASPAGNIGVPLSELASEPADCEAAVVEVSSFQLEKCSSFAPLAAGILNFASDHLDRYHGSFAEYCEVKKRIFDHVAPENRVWGLSFDAASRRVTVRDNKLLLDGREIFDLTDSDLPGAHNAENCACAVELAMRLLPENVIRSARFADALRTFRRGRHRIETVHTAGNVTYVDDSKGTNPASVLAAIDSFAGKIVILLGGLGKGMDFSVLATRAHRFRAAVVYGADGARIAEVLEGKCPLVRLNDDFPEVVKTACELARSGDTVLLSPACASMDMFKNYAERGDRFRELVKKFAGED